MQLAFRRCYDGRMVGKVPTNKACVRADFWCHLLIFGVICWCQMGYLISPQNLDRAFFGISTTRALYIYCILNIRRTIPKFGSWKSHRHIQYFFVDRDPSDRSKIFQIFRYTLSTDYIIEYYYVYVEKCPVSDILIYNHSSLLAKHDHVCYTRHQTLRFAVVST